MSTAIAYLGPARARPNLEVRGDTLVDRIILEDNHARGVMLADGSAITADVVVLAAGAILTPAILQRSGIGPRQLLEHIGVDPLVDLPVGENLFDHASVPLLAVPKDGVWSPDQFSMQVGARFSTSIQPGSFDAQLTMFSYLNARTTGDARGLAGDGTSGLENVAGVAAMLHKPRATGNVRITATDPTVLPEVDPNYLGHATDVRVMREIVRRGWGVLRSQPLRILLEEPLSLTDEIVADDGSLDEKIEEMVAAVYHFSGSCKMASPSRAGVVDQSGAVYGVGGVRVVDASVVPTSPASNMMLPTIMTAERLSARAREQL
jgi:choline dehydrogenase